MKKLYFILLVIQCIGFTFIGNAQEGVPERFEQMDTILNKVILRHEIMGGALLHTRGFGIFFRKGYNQTAFKKNLWEAEFFGIKGDKQVRINFYGAYYSNANSYVFGKLNKVYNLRAGLGQQHLLNTKPYWGGVELRFSYYGGFSLGISKPIYLYIINQTGFNTIDSEKYDPDEHFVENIYGRAPFTDGLNEIKLHPGAYLKAGLNFEFGQFNTIIRALEAGIMIDGYAIPIPIMAFNDPHYYFLNFYLSIGFGKRYNKF
jgi:hypothetical protein